MTSVPELERLFFGAWPAAEVEALGDWRLRFTSGVSRRANSVWPVGASGLALEAAIARAETFRVTPAWWSIAAERSRFAAVPAVYRGLLERIGPRAGFALARLEGEPAASGLGVVEGAFAGVFSMLTLPERRRRGAAQAVLAALARWAERRGAERLALQVERDNPAALALYARAGFREVYGYHYRLGRAR